MMEQEQDLFPDADAWMASMALLTRQFNRARNKSAESEYYIFAALDLSNLAELAPPPSAFVPLVKRASPEPEGLLC